MSLEHLQKKKDYEQMQLKFYVEFLPTIVGRRFDEPRDYGHATYEIIGDHNDWKKAMDAAKIYFHYDEYGKVVLDGNQIHHLKTLCVAVKRLGGLDGPSKNKSVKETLEEFVKKGGKNV